MGALVVIGEKGGGEVVGGVSGHWGKIGEK